MEWLMHGGHVYLGLIAIVLATAIDLAAARDRSRHTVVELLLRYSMGISGFRAIFGGFVMHAFFADEVAASIGWAAGSPFQTEVAFTNLAIGVVGAATFWRRDFWLPYLIASTIFAWGAGLTHVLDLVQAGNRAPNNAGPILYADVLLPLTRLILYGLYIRRPIDRATLIQPA
jgi:hypothetical protein